MSCCAPSIAPEAAADAGQGSSHLADEIRHASRDAGKGRLEIEFSVPDIHCGGCIRSIESGLRELPFVAEARVNLSTKRVRVLWSGECEHPEQMVDAMTSRGYRPHLFDEGENRKDPILGVLIRSVAVAGFAAANIMLLSVSVWSGAEAATRDLFHWISALIATPALAYSGRVFFHSAFSALRHGRLNMDVPISLAVVLAFAMSLYETANSGEHAYFDASMTLLFFLLIGRTLDHVMRERARSAVSSLARLAPGGATVISSKGEQEFVPLDDIEAGMTLHLAAGDRVPVDARVIQGVSDLDCSLVNGESQAQTVSEGAVIRAGTLNLTGALTVEALATADRSFLAEMVRLMEAAEGGKARYRRIADRAAELYAPAVHLIAFLAFAGWLIASGDWHRALYIAIAVLIITCPCALGLAVPVVQVVAAGRLFESGIMVKDGTAMERLAEIDSIVFDKTGTLTLGQPRLVNREDISEEHLRIASGLGSHSRHPVSKALSAITPNTSDLPRFDQVTEVPGAGLQARLDGHEYRLGRGDWALGDDGSAITGDGQTILTRDGVFLAAFVFEDALRPDAAETVANLKGKGLAIDLLSGDRSRNVANVASALGIEGYRAGVLPQGKTEFVAALSDQGRRVLMVGDGLNDAPALTRAHVSMAPATAADIGRNMADFVFLHRSLNAVEQAYDVSCKAGRLIRQNFALAIAYNAIAIPIAVSGYATPLVAALAMSSSSVVVIVNALRLKGRKVTRNGVESEAVEQPNIMSADRPARAGETA